MRKEDIYNPVGWQLVKTGDLLDVIKNGTSLPQNNEKKGLRVSRIETISAGTINFEKAGYVITDVDLNKYLLKKGDILFSHINSVKHIGKVAFFDLDDDLYHGMNLLLLRFKDGVDKKFAFFQLSSRRYKSFCERYCKPAVNQASLNQNDVSILPFILPPLPEQQKIAEILSTVDEAIENSDAIIKGTQQLKKGLMQKLFTEGIGHTQFKKTKIGRVPEEWDLITLKSMMGKKIIVGHLDGNHGSLYPRSDEFVENGIPYLVANCLINGQVDFNYAKFLTPEKASTLRKGFAKDMDVLFAHNATVGPIGILRTELDYVILSTSLTYYRCDQKRLSPHYLYHFMGSQFFTKQFKRVMGQSTRNQVPITAQRAFYHIIPPKEEQKEFVSILSEVDSKIINEQNTKVELEQLKKGLMQVLLTGKIRVKV